MNRVVVLGCGYVGVRVARLFAQAGWDVTGVTRTPSSATQLSSEPFRVIACDITVAQNLAEATELHNPDAIISTASSRGGSEEIYREVYLRGLENTLAELNPSRLVFTSSTSVYNQNDGSWVTEESPALPISTTGHLLRSAEHIAFKAGGIIVRLPGIYGPGRSILLKKFLSNTAIIEGDGSRFLNLIHADDAASALFHVVANDLPPGYYNAADNTPITQLAFYEWLADHFSRPLPRRGEIDVHRKRGVTNKRVSNAKLRITGWVPKYPSYQDALQRDPDLLASVRADETGGAQP